MESVILIGLYNLLVLCQEWCVQGLFAQDEEAGWERDPDYVPFLSSIWKMCGWLWRLRDFQISIKMNLSSSLVISWWVNYSKFFFPLSGTWFESNSTKFCWNWNSFPSWIRLHIHIHALKFKLSQDQAYLLLVLTHNSLLTVTLYLLIESETH